MSKVTFRCKEKNFTLAHDEVFHVGVVRTPYAEGGRWIGSKEEWDKLQSLPDPERVNGSYFFGEGENSNELTLERDDAIEGMRAYIKRNCSGVNAGFITEVKE